MKIDVDVKTNKISAEIGGGAVVVKPPDYSGEYNITPSREAQTLPTAGTQLGRDIVIEPIPENYGLITWNGSFIRVS